MPEHNNGHNKGYNKGHARKLKKPKTLTSINNYLTQDYNRILTFIQ